jgi:hypothetical protein
MHTFQMTGAFKIFKNYLGKGFYKVVQQVVPFPTMPFPQMPQNPGGQPPRRNS